MSDTQVPELRTAQASFIRWFSGATSVSSDTALQLWCKVSAILEANPALRRMQVNAENEADADQSFAEVERGIMPYIKDIVTPVLGALATGALFLAFDFGAVLAAFAALIMFCILLLRKNGSLDGIDKWIREKLSSLTNAL